MKKVKNEGNKKKGYFKRGWGRRRYIIVIKKCPRKKSKYFCVSDQTCTFFSHRSGKHNFMGWSLHPYSLAVFWFRIWAEKNISGALYLERIEILKFYWINILDNFKSCFFILPFWCQRSIDVLDPENQSGSLKNRTGFGALGFTEDVWQQKYENRKECFLNFPKYSSNRIFSSVRGKEP